MSYSIGTTKKGFASELDGVYVNPLKLPNVRAGMISYYPGHEIILNGTIIDGVANVVTNKDALGKFVEIASMKFDANEHDTTDHLVTFVDIQVQGGSMRIAYVSLENSVRSMKAGCGLHTRLERMISMLQQLVQQHNIDIFIFSEAHRGVWTKSSLTELPDIPWWKMRRQIETEVGLSLLVSAPNNSSPLSFGVECYMVNSSKMDSCVNDVQSVQLLPDDGFGCGAVEVQLIGPDSDIIRVMGVHMPLDFKGEGDNNFLYKAMNNLVNHVDTFDTPVSVVMGDFNSIPQGGRQEMVTDGMSGAGFVCINNHKDSPIPTFFAAGCDTAFPGAVFPNGDVLLLADKAE